MTFKVITNPEFTHTVTVDVPVDGGFEEQTLLARFRFVPPGELAGMNGRDYADAVLVSLDDLADAEGTAIPYSAAVREECLGLPWVVLGLVRGYNAALLKARLGN
ncbi:hypothetical protein EGN72_02445 [Pseudorhodobacter sp. E13]|uniref:hypothetical protein n=1 Tax=Pseudorhodobacter sp. E13 TaxID=2487931 RepID=UPI000F8CD48F|nr:hypothetical protein [Pseudorhodobacter sp. E13]RUS64870.1 hypothetical protein EGN72_02445 [Pseudorhodobacter sp. E13]